MNKLILCVCLMLMLSNCCAFTVRQVVTKDPASIDFGGGKIEYVDTFDSAGVTYYRVFYKENCRHDGK